MSKNPYHTNPHFNDIDRALETGAHYLNALRDAIHANAVEKGFQDPPQDIATMSLNTIGEILEHWEAFRRRKLNEPCDKTEGMTELFGETLTNEEEEVADALIRILDLAGRFRVDISRAVRIKHGYNRTRSHRHGNKAA
jgi:NTP pyrophosphatase (non-canonical NTP hydrolase)